MAVSEAPPPSLLSEPAPPQPFRLPPDRPVRVALVGAGYVASFHLQALAEIDEIELAAV